MAVKTFEQYRAEWEAQLQPWQGKHHDTCDGCREREPVTTDGMCRECLRYHYGYDEAEERLVEATVGGVVKGALEGGAPPELIAIAVQRAMQRYHEREADAAYRLGALGGGR